MIESVLAAGLVVGSAEAQQIKARVPVGEPVAAAAADRLKAEAEALYVTPRAYKRAASLHEEEARLRPVSDPRMVEALRQSGRLYTYAGNPAKGRALMQEAAETALRRGDVLLAAHSYLDAAFLALRARDVERALTLAKSADMLSWSPLLEASDRLGIVRRIDPARAQLGLLSK
jgi:hypothetical protein